MGGSKLKFRKKQQFFSFGGLVFPVFDLFSKIFLLILKLWRILKILMCMTSWWRHRLMPYHQLSLQTHILSISDVRSAPVRTCGHGEDPHQTTQRPPCGSSPIRTKTFVRILTSPHKHLRADPHQSAQRPSCGCADPHQSAQRPLCGSLLVCTKT